MKTKYYCKNCSSYFEEEKLPNVNRVHYQCGHLARVVYHSPAVGEEPLGELQ